MSNGIRQELREKYGGGGSIGGVGTLENRDVTGFVWKGNEGGRPTLFSSSDESVEMTLDGIRGGLMVKNKS